MYIYIYHYPSAISLSQYRFVGTRVFRGYANFCTGNVDGAQRGTFKDFSLRFFRPEINGVGGEGRGGERDNSAKFRVHNGGEIGERERERERCSPCVIDYSCVETPEMRSVPTFAVRIIESSERIPFYSLGERERVGRG